MVFNINLIKYIPDVNYLYTIRYRAIRALISKHSSGACVIALFFVVTLLLGLIVANPLWAQNDIEAPQNRKATWPASSRIHAETDKNEPASDWLEQKEKRQILEDQLDDVLNDVIEEAHLATDGFFHIKENQHSSFSTLNSYREGLF